MTHHRFVLLLFKCKCGRNLYLDNRGYLHTSCKVCRRSRRRKNYKARYGHRPYTTPYFKKRRKYIEGKHCAWCGTTENLSIDHIVPLRFDGKLMDVTNWRVLCVDCHELHNMTFHTQGLLFVLTST